MPDKFTMRDPGQEEAIRAAGGVLARGSEISQPFVSNWKRIELRPALFGDKVRPMDEVDSARAQEYALLATLLARSPDTEFLGRLAQLRGDPSPLGMAHAALGEAAAHADVEQVGREYFNLFIGVGRGELLPYASYYLTGFLYERPLARLRGDLKRLGIQQAEGQSEPEDHAAILCEIMAGIVGGQFDVPAGSDREIFEKHMAPWIARLFADLEVSPTAKFYARVGALGRTFIEIEAEAFALPT